MINIVPKVKGELGNKNKPFGNNLLIITPKGRNSCGYYSGY